METAINLAVATYAEISGMNEFEVLTAILNGNETIKNSVMMLTFVSAK